MKKLGCDSIHRQLKKLVMCIHKRRLHQKWNYDS